MRHRKIKARRTGREHLTAIGDRVRTTMSRRSGRILTAVALAAAVPAAFVALDRYNQPDQALTTVADSAGAERDDAAARADRSSRESTASPSASASASPSASPSPPAMASAAPQTTPSPKAPAPTPAPKKKTPVPTKAATAAWVTPMPGAAITSCFGQRWGALHAGVDLAKPENTPIRAAGAGTVTSAGWAFSGYGVSVVIDHHNGYFTHYAHMNKTPVKVGQNVKAAQLIGYEGSTGDSTGPHLHFEVHKGMWNQIEPTAWMRARGVDIPC